MAVTFGELQEYFDPGLDLTIRGTVYTVPLPSAELGLWCQLTAQAAGKITTAASAEQMRDAVERVNALPELDGKNLSLPQRCLGAAYDQMVADKVPHPYVEFAGATAYLWIAYGEEVAEQYWNSGGRPEAVSPANRQERRASTRKTSTAAASTTRRAASTSGTSSPRKSAKPAAARRSRGSKS